MYNWIRYLSSGKAFNSEDKNITKAIKEVMKKEDEGEFPLPIQVDYVLLPRVFFNNTFMVSVTQEALNKTEKHSIQSLGDQFQGFSKKLDTILMHILSNEIPDSVEDDILNLEDGDEDGDGDFEQCYSSFCEYIKQMPTMSKKEKKRMLPTMRKERALLSRTSKQSTLSKHSSNSKV